MRKRFSAKGSFASILTLFFYFSLSSWFIGSNIVNCFGFRLVGYCAFNFCFGLQLSPIWKRCFIVTRRL